MENFSNWILQELKTRGWRQADLARAAHLDSAVISNLVNGRRGPGEDTCTAIAKAFGLPPEAVFRAAGILPQINLNGIIQNELLMFKLKALNDTQIAEVVQFIDFIQERDKRRMIMEGKRGEYE